MLYLKELEEYPARLVWSKKREEKQHPRALRAFWTNYCWSPAQILTSLQYYKDADIYNALSGKAPADGETVDTGKPNAINYLMNKTTLTFKADKNRNLGIQFVILP